MGIATWLKQRRLERTHTKLKHLRAFQSRLREQMEDVRKEKQRTGHASTDLDAKEKKLHDERERLTKQIHELQADEERLKAELKAA